MKISPEQIEFKEFGIKDKLFTLNSFWEKISTDSAQIISAISVEDVGIIKKFTDDYIANIVITIRV